MPCSKAFAARILAMRFLRSSRGPLLIDINTWPTVPTYLELEGPSVPHLQEMAQRLGLDWATHRTENSGKIIEVVYGIPLGPLKRFTFEGIENYKE